MRIRKKKWAQPELDACSFYINNPQEYKGKWASFFVKNQPIELEVGCGKGALSPAAIREAIGMARSTYHDQFHKLVDKGYLVHSHGNTYAFYERPQSVARARSEEFSDGQVNKIGTGSSTSQTTAVQSVDQQNTEINNREPVNNGGINNEIKVPEVKILKIKSPEVMTKERAKLLGYKKEETFEF